jgi:hypothetical protein
MLKKHWQQSGSTMGSEQKTECPVTVLGSMQKPNEDQGGLVCLLDSNGEAVEQIRLPMPAGMAKADNGVLVASQEAVYHVTPDLSLIQQDVVSLPAFNMLHSMARTKRGYLVASTGLDAILEFTLEGELLWSWWAMEHGFEHTPTGERRIVDKDADHRGVKYGTLAQTTHVNSAAELPDGHILASLFHQGMIISIDRASGNWQSVLEGLDHPHAIRILNEHYFTVADTARGRALMVRFEDGKGKIEVEADAQTNWLQDCVYDVRNDCWVLVDGKNSRVSVRTGLAGERLQTQFNLDPEWRLYEILPL